MKLKKVLMICIIAVFIVGLTYFVLNKTAGFEIKLNLIKYHTIKEGDLTVKFYGSGKEVRIVRINNADTGETSKLNYLAKSDVFTSEKDFLVYEDINFDGVSDLLILCADDADGDLHYAAYLFDAGKYTNAANSTGEKVTCLTNYFVNWEKQMVICEETAILTEKATNMDAEIDFEKRTTRTDYKWIDGKFTANREQRISYFYLQENCAYSVYKYDSAEGGLVYSDEKWFKPEMIENYPFD